MFDQYRDRVVVAEIDVTKPIVDDVDIALYDTFVQPEADHDEMEILVDNPSCAARRGVHLVTSTQSSSTPLYARARADISPRRFPPEIWSWHWEAIDAGEIVVSPIPLKSTPTIGLDWPGCTEGLTERESEILALITQGKSNAEITALLRI